MASSASPSACIRMSAQPQGQRPVLPCAGRNVRGGLGLGPRRKAALWAKGELLCGHGRVYPGLGVWLRAAPLSAAPAAPGLCWPPDVSWLQPAGPPHPAHRGALSKAAVRRPRRPPGSSLLAPSPGPAEASEPPSGFCAQVFICSTAQLLCSPGVLQWSRLRAEAPFQETEGPRAIQRGDNARKPLFHLFFDISERGKGNPHRKKTLQNSIQFQGC